MYFISFVKVTDGEVTFVQKGKARTQQKLNFMNKRACISFNLKKFICRSL